MKRYRVTLTETASAATLSDYRGGRRVYARRVATHATLRRHVAQWADQRDATQAKVNRHFTTDQARVMLRSLSPSVKGR